MPSAIQESDISTATLADDPKVAVRESIKPLVYSGSLDSFQHNDFTPSIGREIPDLQIEKILVAPDSDTLIRDLAITVSERGVVFLRNQDVSVDSLIQLGKRLSTLSGSPSSSGLHIHPITEAGSELGDQISVISSVRMKKAYSAPVDPLTKPSKFASNGRHADITFEPVPSDYAILKIHTLPPTGGDTLWASGYEIYDRLSPATAAYLENLTAIHDGNFFNGIAERLGNPLRTDARGSILNQGSNLQARHPVIRTNPVTGWKSVFVNKGFTKRIVELTKDESDVILNYLFDLVSLKHDNQVRFRWSQNDVAIWDNRSNWHAATNDHNDVRIGDRVVSLGEKPYFDPRSVGRREGLERREARGKVEEEGKESLVVRAKEKEVRG
ncbi:probable taurine catabolism dioxygenase [Rhynchosporium graminicola]|uniref:Probable taurine catabolism dioxygenase n=1 Tax=Rhynchosporium graminicola TaxID=2792576 RepID=A0A1E1KFT2_9HELO|nr:probable taurine catabolism dioxygenase [Rhynchosporium commune]